MRYLVLAAIGLYRRYLSPYKGFSCAYRIHTGHASCSLLGYRAVRRHGVVAGLVLLRRRTYRCGVVHRRHSTFGFRPPAGQRGVCDIGCDLPCDSSCHLPRGAGLSQVCDFLSCCDCCSCDWPDRKRKDKGRERSVYIPPKRSSRTARSESPDGDRSRRLVE